MHCDYCNIEYDFIGKIEDFEEGIRYIAKAANFTNMLPPERSKNRLHPSGGKRYSVPTRISKEQKKEKVENYFSRLNAKQLERLYNMYKIDFEMFGYDMNAYI